MTEIIDVYVKSSEKVLKHKLEDGLQSKERYCYWTRKGQFSEVADLVCPKKSKNYIPDKIREGASIYQIIGYPGCWIWEDNVLNVKEAKTLINDIDMEVRLHFMIDGKEKGYFKCFGANKDFTELWFHSEDWFPLTQATSKEVVS